MRLLVLTVELWKEQGCLKGNAFYVLLCSMHYHPPGFPQVILSKVCIFHKTSEFQYLVEEGSSKVLSLVSRWVQGK